MKITLKDGSVREVEQGISVIDLANSISAGLARMATAGKVNGKVVVKAELTFAVGDNE